MTSVTWLFETVLSNQITTWWQRTLVVSKATSRRWYMSLVLLTFHKVFVMIS